MSLQRKKVRVTSVRDDKALVRTLFYDLPAVDDQNSISHAYRRKAVGYQDAGLASSEFTEALKNRMFRFGVESCQARR